jgi:hypothetical protein
MFHRHRAGGASLRAEPAADAQLIILDHGRPERLHGIMTLFVTHLLHVHTVPVDEHLLESGLHFYLRQRDKSETICRTDIDAPIAQNARLAVENSIDVTLEASRTLFLRNRVLKIQLHDLRCGGTFAWL